VVFNESLETEAMLSCLNFIFFSAAPDVEGVGFEDEPLLEHVAMLREEAALEDAPVAVPVLPAVQVPAAVPAPVLPPVQVPAAVPVPVLPPVQVPGAVAVPILHPGQAAVPAMAQLPPAAPNPSPAGQNQQRRSNLF
jgi:hypothetical protein